MTGLWDDVSTQATLARRLWHPASLLCHFMLPLLGNVPLLLREQREESLQADMRRQTGAVAALGCTCAFLFYCFHQPFPHGENGFSLVYMISRNRRIPAIHVIKEYAVPWLRVLPPGASHWTYVAFITRRRAKERTTCFATVLWASLCTVHEMLRKALLFLFHYKSTDFQFLRVTVLQPKVLNSNVVWIKVYLVQISQWL